MAGVGEGRDTNGDINGQAAEVTGGRVALPGVDTRCEVQSEGGDRRAERVGAGDGPAG
jgi:hypothetical protein